MGSVNETKKFNSQKLNDSLSVSSADYKTNIESVCSNKDYINSNISSNIQSDTRENTKISEIKEETFPYKFIWNAGGKIVKIAGTFLDNWKKHHLQNKLFIYFIYLKSLKNLYFYINILKKLFFNLTKAFFHMLIFITCSHFWINIFK